MADVVDQDEKRAIAAFDGEVTVCPPRTFTPDVPVVGAWKTGAHWMREAARRRAHRDQKFRRAAEKRARRAEDASEIPADQAPAPGETGAMGQPRGPSCHATTSAGGMESPGPSRSVAAAATDDGGPAPGLDRACRQSPPRAGETIPAGPPPAVGAPRREAAGAGRTPPASPAAAMAPELRPCAAAAPAAKAGAAGNPSPPQSGDHPALRYVRAVEMADVPPPPPAPAQRLVEVSPLRLGVDPAYQRDVSRRGKALIRRIVHGFDWARFGVLVAIDRNGSFELVDGQHRAIAAATLGVPRVPVLVIESDGPAAGAFVGLNRDRVTVDPCQLFEAERRAGAVEAGAIARVLDALGIALLRRPPQRNTPAEGLATRSISAIRQVHRTDGPAVLEGALGLLADAWPEGVIETGSIRAAALLYAQVLAELGDDDPGAELDRLAATIGVRAQDEWAWQARAVSQHTGGPAWRHMARLIANLHAERGGVEMAVGV